MNIRKQLDESYTDYGIESLGGTKYEWAASRIFELSTYDSELDELFIKTIIDVCKSIINRTTFEYMEDHMMYVKYIIVAQLLNSFNWLEWGTSIRGAWFDSSKHSKPILEGIPFTVDNLKILIDFIERRCR